MIIIIIIEIIIIMIIQNYHKDRIADKIDLSTRK